MKRPSAETPKSIAFMSGCAHMKSDWKITAMKAMKMRGPNTRWVSTRSMRSRTEVSGFTRRVARRIRSSIER